MIAVRTQDIGLLGLGRSMEDFYSQRMHNDLGRLTLQTARYNLSTASQLPSNLSVATGWNCQLMVVIALQDYHSI